MELIENERGPIEAWVNCAGPTRRTAPDELDAAALQMATQSKCFSYTHAIEPVIRRMGARGAGSILNLIGQGDRQANPQLIGGGSAKAALMLATVGYARAHAGNGARVNAINPGINRRERADQNLEAAIRSSGRTRDGVLAEQLADIPMGRMAEPEGMANVAVFLASPRASYVNGVIILMDGAKTSTL